MKLTRRQIKAIENLTSAGSSLNNGVYTMPDGNSFLAISAYSFAIVPGEVPEGALVNRGPLDEMGGIKQVLAKYQPVGDIVVTMPPREELKAYIVINKRRIVGQNGRWSDDLKNSVKPYPLNGGEFLASPFRLLEMVDIMPNATVKTAGPDQPFYFQGGGALGLVMPVRFTEKTSIPELLDMAEEARQAASQPKPKKEKPDNQGQPTNFRQLKKAIMAGAIIEFTSQSGKVATVNSLFNGKPTILCLSGVGASKYWAFQDGYCVNYWDASGCCRGDDDIRFKIRILGPMPEQSEEEKAQEAEQARKYDEEDKARIAVEENERQEAEERERLARLEADAQKIEAAKHALTKGGRIDACTVHTMQDGQEREENIFLHLAQIYGVPVAPRTKGVIRNRVRGIEYYIPSINHPNGAMGFSSRDKVSEGAKDFLFELARTIQNATPENQGETGVKYRYYSTQRPFMPGSAPKQDGKEKVVNFETRQYCEDIGRNAWGYIEYTRPLTPEQAAEYELTPAEQAEQEVATDGAGREISSEVSTIPPTPQTSQQQRQTSRNRDMRNTCGKQSADGTKTHTRIMACRGALLIPGANRIHGLFIGKKPR